MTTILQERRGRDVPTTRDDSAPPVRLPYTTMFGLSHDIYWKAADTPASPSQRVALRVLARSLSPEEATERALCIVVATVLMADAMIPMTDDPAGRWLAAYALHAPATVLAGVYHECCALLGGDPMLDAESRYVYPY